MAVNKRKVAIVGCGRSGSAVSFALMQSGLFAEMVLVDSLTQKAERTALDLAYGISFVKPMNIYGGGYDDLADAGIIVIAAGEPWVKGDTRMDFIRKNVNVLESIVPEIAKRNTEAIFLIVSNPVDILTYAALKYIEIPESRIMGIGTVADTARVKSLIGKKLNVDARNVHAFVVGEHGRSEVPIWSSARISGVPLYDFFEMRGYPDPDAFLEEVMKGVRFDAGNLSYRKEDTFFVVAMAARRVCEAIVRDEKSVLPVSSLMYGAFDIDGIALSMPAVVGAEGVECLVPVDMNEKEADEVRKAAATVMSISDLVLDQAR